MLIYAPEISSRHKYIFSLLITELLGLELKFSTDKTEFINSAEPKINYSKENFNSGLFVEAVDLLFEKDIRAQKINVTRGSGQMPRPTFFKTSSASAIPFDLFAAAFYLVSRYEEYLPFNADEHGRYTAEESLAFKNNFLDQPLVNQWAYLLRDKLKELYPSLVFKTPSYKYISTIDVDNVYAYRGKSFVRTTGAQIKDIFKFDLNKVSERSKVLSGKASDPFDRYAYHKELKEKYKHDLIYFLLCTEPAAYDNAISPDRKEYQQLVKQLNGFAEVALHPSYSTPKNVNKLKDECQQLSGISGKAISKSRQHFLRFNLPDTYTNLIASQIREDHSLGYTTQTGFRAGICSPFYFYDLKKEEATPLKIFPFAFMDFTLCEVLKLSPQQASEKIGSVISEVKKVNGTLISVWHDRTFSNRDIYKGWNEVYEKMLEKAI